MAIKFIAPESNISLWANEVMIKAMDLLTGNDSRENGDEVGPTTNSEKEVYMSNLVEKASENMQTIGEAVFSPDLKFSILKEYSFDEISDERKSYLSKLMETYGYLPYPQSKVLDELIKLALEK